MKRSASARPRAAAGLALAASIVLVAASAELAHAAPATFNPFASAGGFTIVASGDAVLGNGELEGSVAAGGMLSTPSANYPLLHDAAGTADYTVPMIDGVPVRILAGALAGTGRFDLSNRSDSRSIAADSAEANAQARFVDVTALTGSAEGGFLRVTADTGAVLDLKSVAASTPVSTLATASHVDVRLDAGKEGMA